MEDTIRFDAKRISDPVHKTIGLSEVEARVVDTPAFQRLRSVKQLGLANYVFPGADYSRFAHSLGVCHITGRILDAIRQSGTQITDKEKQLYRLAGLLHDVGHYPYSHAMEQPVRNHYSAKFIEPQSLEDDDDNDNTDADSLSSGVGFFEHERVGQEVLTRDAELRGIIEDYGVDPEEVHRVFMRVEAPRFVNLISSDLDADRIDYLLRTSHHTGLPYGSVDIDYLLSQMRIDNEENICITTKALRTADHFLLSRYFDYQQVAFHKTVAALELVLKQLIEILLQEGRIECSAQWVSETIADGSWREFDDGHVFQRIRELYQQTTIDTHQIKARAILERTPPKLLFAEERIGLRETTASDFKLLRHVVRAKKSEWATEFGIDESLWYVWEPPGLILTKIESHVPIAALGEVDPDLSERSDQAIHVLDDRTNSSKLIMSFGNSLMSVLSDHEFYALRVYVLLPEGMESRRGDIEKTIQSDLAEMR